VIFTTDHGELQGDLGLLYKGPYHVDALMRLPLVWRPAPSSAVTPADLSDPVGHVDLAPTFCAIAGIEPAPWMQGRALPTAAGAGTHERALCEWDSQFPGYGMHMRSIYRDGWLCTVYEESTDGRPNGLERTWGNGVLSPCGVHYDGSEGELYRVDEDPYQWHNHWDDAGCRSIRRDLVADLYDSLPAERRELLVDAPA
jgi:arylsulfatase A-like enzyme